MKVAGLQFDIAWEQPDENFKRIEALARVAVEEGARLLVLPEMCATGFSMDVAKLATLTPSIEAWMGSLAYDLQVTVVAGMADALPGKEMCPGMNLARVYNPDGQAIATYQKIHPFSYGEEHRHYHGGNALARFEVEGVRITPYICYDLRFPELFRIAAANTDLMLVIANWPAARRHAWRSLLVARAIENQCFVLGVNRVGVGQGLVYSGDSLLIDPLGEILCDASDRPGVVMGDVAVATVVSVRERFPFLRDRRPALYRALEAVESSGG